MLSRTPLTSPDAPPEVLLEPAPVHVAVRQESSEPAGTVLTVFDSKTGKTFEITHPVRRVSGDEEVMAAEITCRMGLLDAGARRLLPDPRTRLLELATAPALLGG